jgi:G:T-mismatch repair DNA endonuclease (very short patch repair protein)
LWPSKDLRLRCYHSCVVCVYTFVSSCFWRRHKCSNNSLE